jgi:hypothetical protein
MRANHFSRVFFINEESNEMRETEAGERERERDGLLELHPT